MAATAYTNDKGTRWEVGEGDAYREWYIYRILKNRKRVRYGGRFPSPNAAQAALDAMAKKNNWKDE